MQTIKKVLHRNSQSSGSSVTSSDAISSATTDQTSLTAGDQSVDATRDGHDGVLTGKKHQSKNDTDLSDGKVTTTAHALKEQVARQHHVHNVEEVTRERDLERHQHHVQVYHQPIRHEEHADEKLHAKVHAPTEVHEKRASHAKDADLLAKVVDSHGHQAGLTHAPVQHEIHDKGEKVNTNVHHHVHNVIVPLVQHDTHEHHRIQTKIPIHHVVHEAPIIHEASRLEPITHEEAVKRGNLLGGEHQRVTDVNLLHGPKHERKVDGVADQLAKEMNLARANSPALGV